MSAGKWRSTLIYTAKFIYFHGDKMHVYRMVDTVIQMHWYGQGIFEGEVYGNMKITVGQENMSIWCFLIHLHTIDNQATYQRQ